MREGRREGGEREEREERSDRAGYGAGRCGPPACAKGMNITSTCNCPVGTPVKSLATFSFILSCLYSFCPP